MSKPCSYRADLDPIASELKAAHQKLLQVQEGLSILLNSCNVSNHVAIDLQKLDSATQDILGMATCIGSLAEDVDLDAKDAFSSVRPVELSSRLLGRREEPSSSEPDPLF